jgi:hypothetical protein
VHELRRERFECARPNNVCVEEKGFKGTFCFRRTKDKIISLSLLSVVLFLSRFFFCVLSERGATAFVMVRYIFLHSSNNAKSFRDTMEASKPHTLLSHRGEGQKVARRCYSNRRRRRRNNNNENFTRYRRHDQESTSKRAGKVSAKLDDVSPSPCTLSVADEEEDEEEEERRRQSGSNYYENNSRDDDCSKTTKTSSGVAVGKRQTMTMGFTATLLSGFATVQSPAKALARETTAVVEALTSATSGTIKGSVILPSGYHVTRGARSRIQTTSSRPDVVKITNGEKDLGNALRFEVGYANAKAEDEVTVNALVYFCQDDDVCLSRNVSFRAKVVDGGGDSSSSSSSAVDLTYSIPTPEPEISFAVPQFE